MKQWMLGAFFSIIFIAGNSHAADAPSAAVGADVSPVCSKFYNSISADGVAIIKNSTFNITQKRAALGALFNKSVDGDWMGKFVLGRFWKTATPEQQKDYLAVYKNYIEKIYISKFDDEDLADFDLKLVSMTKTQSGDFATKTVIVRPNQAPVNVNYSLSEVGKDCRVRDITIENVSLLTSQRSEFQTLAGQSGIEAIIAAMKKKLS